MPRTPTFAGDNLTVHHPHAPRYLGPPISSHGYTLMDMAKFYGLAAGLWCMVALLMVRYGELFNDLPNKTAAERAGVVTVTLPPLLFAIPVVFIFFWWLAGALVRYSRWLNVPAPTWTAVWGLVAKPLRTVTAALERSALVSILDKSIAAVQRLEEKLWGIHKGNRPDLRPLVRALIPLIGAVAALAVVVLLLFPSLPLFLLRWAVVGPWALLAITFEWLADSKPWQFFWLAMLLFLAWVAIDPLDNIHTVMNRKGLAPAPNLVEMLGNGLFDGNRLRPVPLFQFQWGYSVLAWLVWFLIFVLHWQYLTDGLREFWFYANRFRRYGVSVLTGFNETARLAGTMPVTRDYPRQRPSLPEAFHGVPRLNVDRLTADEARAITAADASGAITAVPGQPTVLFVDLGSYDFSPTLAELHRADGTPLLAFSDAWPTPETRREELVVPLAVSSVGAELAPPNMQRSVEGGASSTPTEEEEAADE
jgi:hypothetical protein